MRRHCTFKAIFKAGVNHHNLYKGVMVWGTDVFIHSGVGNRGYLHHHGYTDLWITFCGYLGSPVQ